MADTTRITVTLPTEQVAELKKLTDNVSGYVAEAMEAQALRLLPHLPPLLVPAVDRQNHGAQTRRPRHLGHEVADSPASTRTSH